MADSLLLTLIRHGKAEKDSLSGEDEDRQLKPKGVKQAHFLGTLLAALPSERAPQVILSSPVSRAAETARIIAQLSRIPLEFHPQLSTSANHHDVMELLLTHLASARLHRVALVGHNPTLEELVCMLCKESSGGVRTAQSVRFDSMHTGMAAVIGFGDAPQTMSKPTAKSNFSGLGFAPGKGTLLECLREDWDD